VWIVPLRFVAIGYLGFVLAFAIAPLPLPGTTETWKPPFASVIRILSENLNTATGVQALRFSGAELLYGLFIAIALTRTVRGVRTDSSGRLPGVGVLYAFLAVAFAGVLMLELLGLARGGDFRQSLWQFRQLFWLPILTGLFSYCLRDTRDLRTLAGVVTAAACVKVALGLYYVTSVQWPDGKGPDSITGHDDSVLYAAVVATWLAAWAHRPTRRGLVRVVLPCAWILVGIGINNRRLAFVSLVGSLFVLYILLEGPAKQWINRRALLLAPVIALYLFAGRTHSNGIFKPAAQLMSVSKQSDASSKTRDIENFNLIQTLKPNKLLGTGWGHEYNEIVVAYDIAKFFAQYRYIAHNSILWLLSIGGVVGFTMIWMPVVVGTFLAARSYRCARDSADRTAAAAVLVVLVCFTLQAWGDMGTQGWTISPLVACALAGSGKLAYATGAWRPGTRLLA
jgi:hypothetical protein